eukprot:9440096-Pyramimonas_sp.AAC.1
MACSCRQSESNLSPLYGSIALRLSENASNSCVPSSPFQLHSNDLAGESTNVADPESASIISTDGLGLLLFVFL